MTRLAPECLNFLQLERMRKGIHRSTNPMQHSAHRFLFAIFDARVLQYPLEGGNFFNAIA